MNCHNFQLIIYYEACPKNILIEFEPIGSMISGLSEINNGYTSLS